LPQSDLTPVVIDQPLAADPSTPLAADGEAFPPFVSRQRSGAAFGLRGAVRLAPAAFDQRSGSSAPGGFSSAHGPAFAADFFSTDRITGPATGWAVSSPHYSVPTTEAPSSPSPPDPGSPVTGLSGSFAPPTTALFFAVLLVFCFAPCLRYGKVVLTPAHWRPLLFLSLLERPG
jgi:hypothetical protein